MLSTCSCIYLYVCTTRNYVHFPGDLPEPPAINHTLPTNTFPNRASVNSPPSITQSLTHTSPTPTHRKIPTDSASSVPSAIYVLFSLPINTLSPITIPIGMICADVPTITALVGNT